MKVRLSEIAKQANVSVSTVSRILSGDTSRRASAETVERVFEAARTLGWVDNRAESIRRTQKLLKIGIIFISDYESLASEFFQSILIGAERELGKRAKEVNLSYYAVTTADADYEERLLDFDAAIILGRGSWETIDKIITSVPVVVYAGVNSIGDMDEVLCDVREGMKDAVRYLYSKGHRRIAYIGPAESQGNIFNEHRYQGYLEGLDDVGIGRGNAIYEDVYLSPADGYAGTGRLLDRVTPTAIVAANDNTAIGVLRKLKEKGIKVPEDVSLIGFDNSEASGFLEPALTTFDVPKSEIGRFAAKMLVDACMNKRDFPVRLSIPYTIVERESAEGIM